MMIQVEYLQHTHTQNIFKIPKSVTWLSSFPLSAICCSMHIRVFAEQIVTNKRKRYGWNGDWSLTNWISIYVRENVCMNVSKCVYVGVYSVDWYSSRTLVNAIAIFKFYFWFSIFSSGKFNGNPSIWDNRSAWTFHSAMLFDFRMGFVLHFCKNSNKTKSK